MLICLFDSVSASQLYFTLEGGSPLLIFYTFSRRPDNDTLLWHVVSLLLPVKAQRRNVVLRFEGGSIVWRCEGARGEKEVKHCWVQSQIRWLLRQDWLFISAQPAGTKGIKMAVISNTSAQAVCYCVTTTNLKIDNGSVRTETFICCFVEIPIPKLYKTI